MEVAVEDDSILPEGTYVWEECEIKQPSTAEQVVRERIIENKESMIPKFLGNKKKVINIPEGTSSALQFFQLLFCTTILNTFVTATNSYATNTGTAKWRPINSTKLLKFFGAIIFMGVVTLPERKHYWSSSKFTAPFITKLISGRSFEAILSNLHWMDTSGLTQVQRNSYANENGFWQTDGFTTQLATNFRKYWNLQQFIDIDEMSIYFKGRHRCRCYNPNKPEKWHFKAFALNDAGYLWSFYMYQGATERRPAGWSATAYPIKKLMEDYDMGIRGGINRIMCLDNWYTSIEVAIFLWLTYKVYLIGTVKTNRKGLPKEHIFPKKGPNKKDRGVMTMVKAMR